jgi:hypothetical protein
MSYSVTGGTDKRAEAIHAMSRAAYQAAGGTLDTAERYAAGDFLGESWADVARRFLGWQGIDARGLDNDSVVGRAWDEGIRAGATTATLPGFVASVFTLSVGRAYSRTQNFARRLCRMVPVKDFRTGQHVIVDGVSSLSLVSEGGTFTAPTLSDRTEALRPRTYGANVPISRHVALAGDVRAIVAAGDMAGRAARNVEDDLLVDLLLQNSQTGPTLNADSTVLFHTSHANIVTSGAAPSVATLQTGMAAIRKQTDAQSVRVQNIAPKFLVCPAALEVTARVIVASLYNAAAADNLEVIPAARLDSTNPAGWYLCGDPNLCDTFALSFIGDPDATEPEPAVFQPQGMGWASDAVIFKVRHDVGVSALDFRGAFYNDGA